MAALRFYVDCWELCTSVVFQRVSLHLVELLEVSGSLELLFHTTDISRLMVKMKIDGKGYCILVPRTFAKVPSMSLRPLIYKLLEYALVFSLIRKMS